MQASCFIEMAWLKKPQPKKEDEAEKAALYAEFAASFLTPATSTRGQTSAFFTALIFTCLTLLSFVRGGTFDPSPAAASSSSSSSAAKAPAKTAAAEPPSLSKIYNPLGPKMAASAGLFAQVEVLKHTVLFFSLKNMSILCDE